MVLGTLKVKKENLSRVKILQAAQSLMLRKGYTATTIDQICEEAGMTKGSFFHHFKNKEHLAKVVMEYYWTSLQSLMGNTVFQKKDPLERIYRLMDFAIEIYNTPLFETSCLLGNFAQEISATNDELRNLCNGYLAQQVAIVKKQFDEAKVFHSTISKIDTSSLASSLIAVIQGSILLAKASQDRNMIKKSLEHYRKYIRMLFQG